MTIPHVPRRLSYLDGWRQFPQSCLGHHLQGVAVGVLIGSGEPALMMAGGLYALGYFAYQFGSAWRKDVTGKIDSPGLDVIDLTAPAGIVAAAMWAALRWLW